MRVGKYALMIISSVRRVSVRVFIIYTHESHGKGNKNYDTR